MITFLRLINSNSYFADANRQIEVSVNGNKLQGPEYEVKEDDGIYVEFVGSTNQVLILKE